jgi:zinc protease
MLEHMAFDNTVDYPGRGGIWHAIERSDVGYFNAFTSFRSTVYQLLDVGTTVLASPTAALEQTMKIFYNQVGGVKVDQQYLDAEKGAVLGEDRMRKSSMINAVMKTLVNHGGGVWRIGSRLPIGKDPVIRSWTAKDVQDYNTKWYHPARMTLYLVGDVELDLARIEAQLGRLTSTASKLLH